MAISNYTELAAAVQKYMVYDDISSEIDTLLPLAEAVLNREIRIRELQSFTKRERAAERLNLYRLSSSGVGGTPGRDLVSPWSTP